MKFLVVLNVIYNDDTPDKTSVYKYATEVEAVANFHKYLGQYIGGENVKTVLCMAINSVGGIYKNEFWSAPEPAVELVLEEDESFKEE